MKSLVALGATLLGLSTTPVIGAVLRAEPLSVAGRDVSPAVNLKQRQSCTNGPTSRNCWLDGFDADTDMYQSWPNTGHTATV
jgi:hypothetical protein